MVTSARNAAELGKVDHVLSIFRKFDERADGTIKHQALSQVLLKLDPALDVNTLLGTLGNDEECRLRIETFIRWLFYSNLTEIRLGTAPLCRGTLEQRALFIEKEWTPFISEIRDALVSTRTRHTLGFSPEEVQPPRESWIHWADRNRELTAKWHGRSNVSVLYELLIECGRYDGDSLYDFRELSQAWSDDRWVRVVDGNARKGMFKKKDELQTTRTDAVSQMAGESPIDNSVLPNIMTAAESHVLLAGKLIKDYLVRRVAIRERKCLVNLAKLPSMPTTALCSLPRDRLSSVLESLSEEELAAASVSRDSGVFRALQSRGAIISSFGQFISEQRFQIQEFLNQALGAVAADAKQDDLDEFVAFIRQHPGRIYQDNGMLHHEMFQKVLHDPHYVIVKRSALAKFTAHRYFTDRWERTYPLIELPEEGGENELRPSGAKEFSRFRKNAFPYLDSHGMSLSSGGIAEGSSSYKNVAYEAGVSLAMDESAKLGNWFASDFEKILMDAVALNPASGIEDMLPGEAFHDLCQNPRHSSSIRETQHIQISRGSTSMWPVMMLESKPMQVPALNGTLDIVQIGNESDAFHVCIQSQDIASPVIVEMLCELRLLLCRRCGSSLDFCLFVAPQGNGLFRASLAPILDMKPGPDGEYWNSKLDEGVSKYNVPVNCINATDGKGNMVLGSREVWKVALEGAPMLRRLYDFNRFPGTRAIVADFLHRRYGYIDDVTGMCSTLAQAIVPNGGQGPSLVDALFAAQQ